MSLMIRMFFILICVAFIGGFLYLAMIDLPITQETVVKEVKIDQSAT